jgi:ribulose bisphosphate carboxylase small subunit
VGTINYSQAIKPDTAYIKKIIENSLLSDWAVRIEYLSPDAETAVWQLWDKTFFALSSARPVMTALAACYEKHSSGAIRIAAEKFRPQTRLIHMVYTPHVVPEETICKPQTITRKKPREIGQPFAQTGLST